MASRTRLAPVGAVVCLLMLGVAAQSALASQRYASPTPDLTPDPACPASDPCALEPAVEGASSGDEVIVLPGNHTLTAGTFIQVPGGVTVHGQDGQAPPIIVGNYAFALFETLNPNVVLRRLGIRNAGPGILLSNGMLARNLSVEATGAGQTACYWTDVGTLTDSVCWGSNATNSRGAGANTSGGTITATLRNVTAVGALYGLDFGVNDSNTASTVNGKNVIAKGGDSFPGVDVRSSAFGGTTTMTVTLDYSNYDSTLPAGTGTATDPGAGNNQTAAPLFVNAASGNFHQATSPTPSPTIDAGTLDPQNGPTDIDDEDRFQGPAPDIGADERTNADPDANDDSRTVDEDASATALNVLGNDSDLEVDPITVQSVSDPAQGTATIMSGGTDVQYQPDANFCGSDSFTYTVNHGDTATVSITVSCVDDTPVAANDSQTLPEDAPSTPLQVLANDTDIDGGPKAAQSTTAPEHGTAEITGGGDVAYQPAANYCGPDSLTYTLNGNSTATVSITVTCVDDAPAAVADSATIAQDATATAIPVLANDTDVDGGPKTVASKTDPAHGTAAIAGGGSGVTYQPAAGYCGPDSFTYALNGGSSATVSITVTCAPDTLAPRTSLRGKPPKTTRKRKATFRFTSNEAGSTFLCKLDRKRFRVCGSPVTFTVRPGKHVLRVKAVDPAGNADATPAVYRWKVLPPPA